MSLQGQVEAAQPAIGDRIEVGDERLVTVLPVSRERVCSALEDNGAGLVELHDSGHDGDEDTLVAGVVNAVTEGEVEAVVLPSPSSNVPEVSSPGEVLSVLVEADGHDPVRGVEGLLHPVSVVNVNIDVEDSLVVLEELQDGQDNVIDIAEATGLGFLGVVKSSSPVDGDVCCLQEESQETALLGQFRLYLLVEFDC